MKNYSKVLSRWVDRIDGEWISKKGTDVSKVFWHPELSFWKWYVSMDEKVLTYLVGPSNIKKAYKGVKESDILKINRYLVKSMDDLAKYAKSNDYRKFTILAKKLTLYSKTFRLTMFNMVEPKWYEKWSKLLQRKVHSDIQRIFHSGSNKFKFKRVWIPKPDGTARPLAVPTKAWRIVSKWMLLLAMTWWEARWGQENLFHPRQVGGIRKRNAVDAWDHIFKKILNKKYVVEFDIAKCFDTVSWKFLQMRLLELDTPAFLHNFIMGCVTTAGNNIKERDYYKEWEDLLNEQNQDITLQAEDISTPWYLKPLAIWRAVKKTFKGDKVIAHRRRWAEINRLQKDYQSKNRKYLHPMPIFDEFIGFSHPGGYHIKMEDVPSDILSNMSIVEALGSSQGNSQDSFWNPNLLTLKGHDFGMGLPQGWALSPVLANLLLRDAIPESMERTIFLDDGIVASDTQEGLDLPMMTILMKMRGWALSEKKFSWIVYENRWIKDVKFLGALATQEAFRAATRAGADIKLILPGLKTLRVGSMSNIGRGKSVIAETLSDIPFDEVQLSYMYNNGGIYDNRGNWVPLSIDRMWAMSWKSKRMKKWRNANPEKAKKLLSLYQVASASHPRNSKVDS